MSAYTRVGRSSRGKSAARTKPRSSGPTKASIAAYERELKTAQRNADIEKVGALEKALVGVHKQSFPKAERTELPPIEPVDPAPIQSELEIEAGIPGLLAKLGRGDAPPVAASPEPVDRYELMREHRKRERQGIPIWQLRERIEAARRADALAETAADEEEEEEEEEEEVRRRDTQAAEQTKLDELWAGLQSARSTVADRLVLKVAAEKESREAERNAEQAELDREWERLQANEPEPTMMALEQAFADNEAPAAPLNCEGDRVTVLMQFQAPEVIVPERKPGSHANGKANAEETDENRDQRPLCRSPRQQRAGDREGGLCRRPWTQVVRLLVVRRETEKKHAGEGASSQAADFQAL